LRSDGGVSANSNRAAWVGAACEQQLELGRETGAYTRRRLAQARAGELDVTVEHADVLILP
jgi:hypothetical protein